MIRTLDLVRSAALATGLVFAGCMDRDLTGMDPNVQSVTSLVVPQPPSGKVDILVVVDNSGSMKEEQAALVANFPTLIDELMNPTDPANHAVTDLSVGVVTTDMGSFGYALNTCNNGALGYLGGDDGCFRNTGSVEVGGCLSSYPLFLQRNGLNAGSYPLAQMGTDFRCIATLGTNGCGAEQQMEAARRALVDQTGVGRCNAGFLRPDSILAVLWVTDEEDCSVADPRLLDPDATSEFGHPNIRCYFNEDKLKRVDDMIGQLRALRPNPRDFVMAMIVGVPRESICEGKGDELEGCLELPPMQYVLDGTATQVAPSCSSPSGFGDAYPARRFVQAAQLLGKNALVRSICNDDWRPAVRGILELIQGAVSDVCFPRELALDPATCRAECNIVEILSDDRMCPAGRAEADPPTMTGPTGIVQRRCIIPQAARVPVGDGTCPPTAASGWYYVPSAQSAAGCDQVLFAADAVPEPLSSTRLECLSYVCPAERRCGGASNPGGRCCGQDQACVDFDPLTGGTCASL
jgi:hypothetical protein